MLLRELSEAVGVSGDERAVREIVLRAITDHVTDIQIDPLGGVTAIKPASGANPLRVMIAAHMDEVGFMVRGIDGEGLIRFGAVGGFDERILPGLRVLVGAERVPGVIIWVPIHHNRDDNVVKITNLRIDIGATSKDQAAGKVKTGDRIAFSTPFTELSDQVVRGKAFDDRAGVSLLIDVLQAAEAYPVEVIAAFTVQEEIGLRGAKVAASRRTPDLALILEGTTANDTPDPFADPDSDVVANPTCRMGAGPVLTIMDRSAIIPPRLLAFLRHTADANTIPYQLKSQLGGGTDAGAIQISGAGVPSAVIALPCRYIHTPAALLNRADYDHMLQLVKATLNSITAADFSLIEGTTSA